MVTGLESRHLSASHAIVANWWTEFTAFDCYAMGANVKICKNLNKTLVAATSLKAKTYVFARPIIRDREVGGSNPLAPTI